MVHQTPWDPRNPGICQAKAEQRVLNRLDHTIEFAYRFEDVTYAAPLDECGDPIPGGGTHQVELQAFHVYKRTPKGFWISHTLRLPNHIQTKGRFVLLEANKHYACLTIEEAKKSFLARKKRQRDIHLARANKAERAMSMLHGVTIGSFY